MKRDFLSIRQYKSDEICDLLKVAHQLKKELKAGVGKRTLEGKTLAMVFQKPSNRTRISFEVGMYQLGGTVVFIKPDEIRMGEREPISDIARVMSRYVDAVMIRTFSHRDLEEFAHYATVPVINGLSDCYHPCQALADIMTIEERFGSAAGRKIVYVGDGNNVCHSLVNIAGKVGAEIVVCCPEGYEPDRDCMCGDWTLSHDPQQAVKGADVVYTDVWTSMGQEEETERRLKEFQGYSITTELMFRASDKAIFMHCLPAHRGEEVAADVVESAASVIFDQAENRLHAQKAVLQALLVS